MTKLPWVQFTIRKYNAKNVKVSIKYNKVFAFS